MKRNDLLPITLVLAAYLALALAYSVVIPPFEGLDEVEHFGVTRYVADTGRLPVQGDPALDSYYVRQEASQPPLYYLLAGPLLRASRVSTADTPKYLAPNPYVTCGTEAIRLDKATLRHEPDAEAFPWRGALLALHLLRAFSILLQAFTIAGVYAIARRVFPRRRGVPILAAALTAFNPQFLIVASGVNNDNIATPVITWALYVIVLIAQEGPSLKRTLALGALVGLAALSKITGLLLLPLAVISYFIFHISDSTLHTLHSTLHALRSNLQPLISNTQSLIANLAILTSATAAIAGWWYVRNWQLYGDPTGLAPMLDIVGRRGPVPLGLLLSELGLVFRSYWGQFSCAFLDSTFYYSAWAVIATLGLIGAIYAFYRKVTTRNTQYAIRSTLHTPRSTFYILIGWLALVLIGWLRWDLTTPAPGGRLLFAAVGATSTLLAYGLVNLPLFHISRLTLHAPPSTPPSPLPALPAYAGTVAMVGVGLLALLVWVRPLFAPPPMRPASQIAPQHSLNAQFGADIELLGYDLRADDLGPGRFVDVTFYWRARQPIQADYTLALQLVALPPGDTRSLLNFNTWPGGGNLPTPFWPVGPVIVDRYRVPLPLNTGLTQAWKLQAVLYDEQSHTRLPLALNTQPAGDALTLGVYRVAGASIAALPDTARLASPVKFDQAVALTHAQVKEQAGSVRVSLLWQSLAPLPHDVTVFVHAYDAGGALVATGDGPPAQGNLPTSLWQSGDQILDTHLLTLPITLSLNSVRITTGLYQPEDGVRLQATTGQGAVHLKDDEVVIWP